MPTTPVTISPEALTLFGLILTTLCGVIVYLHRTALSLAADRAGSERERAIRAEKLIDQVVPALEKVSTAIERVVDQNEKLIDLIRGRP